MTRTWTGVFARLGVPTGDGRILAPGGITHRDLPLPLSWQEASSEGHGGSIVVGRMESVSFRDGMVTASGTMLDSAPSSVIEQLEAGVIGPSVDLDDIEYVMDDQERIVITRGRIAGATLVAIPAFAGVSITLDPEPVGTEPALLLASVRTSGWSDMPIADESRAWDGNAAAGRVFSWATEGETTDWSRYARAFLRKDDDANPETRGAYSFGIADVIDGALTIVPRGVFAAAAAVQGARTGKAPADAEGMKSVLRGIYERLDREAPFSLAASVAPAPPRPPLEWFARPDLDRLTPLTVSDTGRVFGHVAGWDTCHVGLPGCVTAPRSFSNYAHFLLHSQTCQDGTELPVGVLTVGGGHAEASMAWRPALEHYDNVGTAVAKVMAGEDEFGIWVAGWMLPQVTPEQREVFLSAPVSGDWREIGGALEMIAVCSVNAPGFPVPRARVSFALGRQRTLIASTGMKPVVGEFPEPGSGQGADALARWKWATAQKGRA